MYVHIIFLYVVVRISFLYIDIKYLNGNCVNGFSMDR